MTIGLQNFYIQKRSFMMGLEIPMATKFCIYCTALYYTETAHIRFNGWLL